MPHEASLVSLTGQERGPTSNHVHQIHWFFVLRTLEDICTHYLHIILVASCYLLCIISLLAIHHASLLSWTAMTARSCPGLLFWTFIILHININIQASENMLDFELQETHQPSGGKYGKQFSPSIHLALYASIYLIYTLQAWTGMFLFWKFPVYSLYFAYQWWTEQNSKFLWPLCAKPRVVDRSHFHSCSRSFQSNLDLSRSTIYQHPPSSLAANETWGPSVEVW